MVAASKSLIQKVDVFDKIIILSCLCKNLTEPIFHVISEESMCAVIMKCNTAVPGKAYCYYSTLNMLVYLNITNKTYFENANLFWKYASTKNWFWVNKEQL